VAAVCFNTWLGHGQAWPYSLELVKRTTTWLSALRTPSYQRSVSS